MKKIIFLFVLLPVVAFGQFDFETRYFVMDAVALPEIPELGSLDSDFGTQPTFQKKSFKDFNRVTTNNYWMPVDMTALLTEEPFQVSAPAINLPTFNQKEFGFSVSVNGSNSRNGTTSGGLRNSVYKEMRPVYFCQRTGLNLLTQ